MIAVEQPAAASKPDADAPAQCTCVLVLGMHRSGTSALTRLLSLAGAALPLRLMPAGPGNESGHWEPQHLVDCHDRLLGAIGSAWHDWTEADLSRLSGDQRDAVKAEIQAILREDYPDGDIIVVKDPRICRFVPFFMEVVAELGWRPVLVHAFRNPLDVVNSLTSRKLVWPLGYTTTEAAFLWLRHVLDSELACRGRQRALVSFDSLMADPAAALSKIGIETGLDLPKAWAQIEAEVRTFLSPSQRHHAYAASDLDTDPDTKLWLSEAFEALSALERNPGDGAATATLDAIAAEFNRLCPLMARLQGEGHREQRQTLSVQAAEIANLNGQLEQLGFQKSALHAEVADLTGQLASANAALAAERDHSEAQRLDFARHLADLEMQRQREAQAARQHIDSVEADRERLMQEILQLQQQIADTHAMYLSSTSWRVTTPLRAVSRTPATVKEAVRALPQALGGKRAK